MVEPERAYYRSSNYGTPQPRFAPTAGSSSSSSSPTTASPLYNYPHTSRHTEPYIRHTGADSDSSPVLGQPRLDQPYSYSQRRLNAFAHIDHEIVPQHRTSNSYGSSEHWQQQQKLSTSNLSVHQHYYASSMSSSPVSTQDRYQPPSPVLASRVQHYTREIESYRHDSDYERLPAKADFDHPDVMSEGEIGIDHDTSECLSSIPRIASSPPSAFRFLCVICGCPIGTSILVWIVPVSYGPGSFPSRLRWHGGEGLRRYSSVLLSI